MYLSASSATEEYPRRLHDYPINGFGEADVGMPTNGFMVMASFRRDDSVVHQKLKPGTVKRIAGYYYPTARNALVADLFARLGFTLKARGEKGETEWTFAVGPSHEPTTRAITVAR